MDMTGRISVRQIWTLLILSIVVLLFGPAQPVAAATFTVNHTGDVGDANPGDNVCATSGGVCTLRAAIQENNAGAGGNTISIPAGYTIVVGAELLVTQSVTLNGGNQSTTIIDGNNATRVFKFQDARGTHSISNLTIRNGYYIYPGPGNLGGGGGIFNEANLTLTDVTLSNNRATQGGGIFNQYAAGASDPTPPTLNLTRVTLVGNTALSAAQGQGGGGLFNGGVVTANSLTLTGNSAGYQGGGIYINSYFAANLTNFTISNNTAKMGGGISNEIDHLVSLNTGTISGNVSNCCDVGGQPAGGGGIVNNDGTMSLTDVTISGNTATSTGGYGGGIVNIQQMTLNRVTISGNSAQYGAGIYNGASPLNSMTLTNVTISGNNHASPAAGGGGIWNTTYGNLTLANATFTLNSAAQSGGIQNMATAVLRNTIVAGNLSTTGYPPDCAGSTLSSSGYNLIGSTAGCSFASTTGDLLNTNPLLGSLQNNGGATFTHALGVSSPAINTGNPVAPGSGGNACPAVDQRNVARPQGGRCDIGAYESNALTITLLSPSSKWKGSSGFTLVITGTNFSSGNVVQWDGADRATTFVNSTQLTASINASDLIIPRTVLVRVRNPADSTVSNTLSFWVIGPLYLPIVLK
jgi:hypothetical protein